jgi:uncharacterized repeat protein (TIGR01451 family)
MKHVKRENLSGLHAFSMLLAVVILMTVATKTAAAKSLYLIADKGSLTDGTQPVHAYDIGDDGVLTFRTKHDIRHTMLGAVGIAIDSDAGFLFITYEHSGDIQLLDVTTMKDAGRVTAPDAMDLAGIVYDHTKRLLYCVDRGREKLYVYDWDAKTISLTRVNGSPFTLWGNVHAYGIALDELAGLLYVANATNTVNIYNTSDWSSAGTISPKNVAISIAVDVINGFVYTGGGYAGDRYLTQYHLVTDTQTRVQVEPDAGVIGLAVDQDTSLVYMSTGQNNAPGGDNLLVYDAALNLVNEIPINGDPTGLVIQGKVHHPLNLSKSIHGKVGGQIEQISVDDVVTYTICFDNNDGDFAVTDVLLVDFLPAEVSFVSADDSALGSYDDATHSYTWSYPDLPPGSAVCVGLVVQVKQNIPLGTTITNSAIISSNETPPFMVSVDAITVESPVEVQSLRIVPDTIRRSGDAYDVQAIMVMPPGINGDDIRDVKPVLKPGNVIAKDHAIFSGPTMTKVIAKFDKAELLDAVDEYGYVTLRVIGKLKSGRSFAGEATVYISRFTGN